MNNNQANQILQIIESPVWREVEKQWALQREAIIQEGKKARSDVKKTECWAELTGFDKAITRLHNIAQFREEEHTENEEE